MTAADTTHGTPVAGGRWNRIRLAGVLWKAFTEIPWYAGLLPVNVILWVAVEHLSLFDLSSVIRPVALAMVAAAIAVAMVGAVLRDVHRAAVLVAAMLTIGLSFVDLGRWLGSNLSFMLPHGLAVLTGFTALAVATLTIVLLRPGILFTQCVSVVAVAMIAVPVWQLAAHDLQRHGMAFPSGAGGDPVAGLLVDSGPAAERPDIIHIVLDGYSRADVLSAYYGFDNGPFIGGLRDLGFAVADQATAPYNQTLLTMSAVLGAEYVDRQNFAQQPLISASSYRQALADRLDTSAVLTALRRMGYRIVATDVQADFMRLDREATVIGHSPLSNLEQFLIQRSAVMALGGDSPAGSSRDYIDRSLAAALAVPQGDPFYLFVHLLAPHPPFDIGADGGPMALPLFLTLHDGDHATWGNPYRRRKYRDGYLEKLRFINGRVLDFVQRVIDTPGPKIILLHGDHGGGMYLDHNEASQSCLEERLSTLLAVYSSDGRLAKAVSNDTNLVNLFRITFRTYFNASIARLEDRIHFASWDNPQQVVAVDPTALDHNCPVPIMPPNVAQMPEADQ